MSVFQFDSLYDPTKDLNSLPVITAHGYKGWFKKIPVVWLRCTEWKGTVSLHSKILTRCRYKGREDVFAQHLMMDHGASEIQAMQYIARAKKVAAGVGDGQS